MFYSKNLPTWERAIRFLGAAIMALCSWQYSYSPLGIAFGVSAAIMVLTAMIGFCPMCALAGRKLKAQQN